MKIGCFAVIELFSSLRRQFELIAEMGFKYADLANTNDGAELMSTFQHSPAVSLDSAPWEIRKAAEDCGIELTTVCAHASLLDPPCPSIYSSHQIIKAVKLAHFLGIRHVVTTEGEPITAYGKSLTFEQRLFAIQERLYYPIHWAKELKIELLIEPHGPVSDDMAALDELLARLGEPETVGINLDTGNLWLGGGEPLKYIEHYGPRIKHVHWKDYPAEWKKKRGTVYGSGKSDIPLGDGIVGIKEIARELVKTGFEGATTLEIGGREAVRISAERLREWTT